MRAWATVDLADFRDISAHRWFLNAGGYAARQVPRPGGGQRVELMHRRLLGLETGNPLHVDHINRERLDNRRRNLRAVTPAQNAQNQRPEGYAHSSSRYRGVSWYASHGKWAAQGFTGGKLTHLGFYDNEEEAARVVRGWRVENLPYAVN